MRVTTLGEFSVRRGENSVAVGGRSRKLALLLAYLIAERGRVASAGELTALLGLDAPGERNPLGALKALVHRARAALDGLGEGLGRALILSREGGFQWNAEVPLALDAEEFTRLLARAGSARSAGRALELRLEALGLYGGDFLPALADCPWAERRRERLRSAYFDAVPAALSPLEEGGRWAQAAGLSGAALELAPLEEGLCLRHMEALLHLQQGGEAARAYEDYQARLLRDRGLMPSDRLRELYRRAQGETDPRALVPATLAQRLREPAGPGALLCDFDYFRAVCHAAARRAARSGEAVHVALLTLEGWEGRPVARHSLDRAMDNLQPILLSQLRRGDTVARCGASQFVLLLPQADYPNSRAVCDRVRRAFVRQYPHAPVGLDFSVQPLPIP